MEYGMTQCLYPTKKIAKKVIKRHPAKQVIKRDDPFTRLPDALIMSHILSRFPSDERARLCILSRRWKKLLDGGNIGAKLIFTPEHLASTATICATISTSEIMLDGQDARMRRRQIIVKPSYIRWISNVVQASYGALPKLDELTVRYPFNSSHAKEIEMWLECAFKRGVSRLELHQHYYLDLNETYYSFPEIDKFQGMLSNCVYYYNLRDVELRRMSVTAEVIECMLAHFPLLERLCIMQRYEMIGKLSISGHNRLKSLELSRCDHLTISASNLTSFTYAGTEDSVLFQHVPNLSELSVDWNFSSSFLQTGFLNAGGYVTRLKRLEVVMSRWVIRESIHYPIDFHYTLSNLEELKVEIYGDGYVCIAWPIFLIQAAPFLRKFSAEVYTVGMSGCQLDPAAGRMWSEAWTRLNHHHHQHLKTIEFHRYQAHFNNDKLVIYLLRVSDVLEEFIISPLPGGEPKSAPLSNRAKAHDLANRLPPILKAKLIIL